MKQRRTRYEIMEHILLVCKRGAKISGIVYMCNLNFEVVKPYLAKLLSTGLLKCERGAYLTTEIGRDWMERFRVVREFGGQSHGS